MKMTEYLLAQLEREVATSKRALERVPEGRNDFKPHEKSMRMGYLANLVAMMPAWIGMVLTKDEMDIHPVNGPTFHPEEMTTTAALVDTLEKSAAGAREALSKVDDAFLLTHWKLLAQGKVLSDLPRHVVIADSVFAHMAHHRGQLTVYLRLNEARVPALYGPSADEPS